MLYFCASCSLYTVRGGRRTRVRRRDCEGGWDGGPYVACRLEDLLTKVRSIRYPRLRMDDLLFLMYAIPRYAISPTMNHESINSQ